MAAHIGPARIVALLVVAGSVVALSFPSMSYAGHAMDEGLLLVYPELILRGLVPSRDFFASYGPGDFWTLAAAYSVFGLNVGVERTIGVVYHLALATALFAHAYRWNPTAGVLAGIFAAVVLLPLEVAAFAWLAAAALVLWSLYVLSTVPTRLGAICGGALAAAAIVFRPELAPAAVLSTIPLIRSRTATLRPFLIGFALPLILLAGDLLAASPSAVIDNLVLGALRWGPGRYLPLPGHEPTLLLLLVVADLGIVVAGALAVRKEPAPRSLALLSVGIFSVATIPQALQRADLFHLAAAGVIAFALLPVTAFVLADLLARSLPVRPALVGMLVAMLLLTIGAPRLILRAALVEAPRAAGLEQHAAFEVAHRGRWWYPMAAWGDFAYAPDGSAASADELGAMLDDVDRIAAPGSRLFVGPRDLRRTNMTDTVIYHLLPQLVPGTYYLEMAPGTTNGPGSHLADDIERSDVLVLTDRYDDWSEPNASVRSGPDGPNVVVRDRFELRATHGHYGIYVRRVAAADDVDVRGAP